MNKKKRHSEAKHPIRKKQSLFYSTFTNECS